MQRLFPSTQQPAQADPKLRSNQAEMEKCCREEERRTWGPISYLIQALTSLLAELDGEKSHAEVQVALLQSAPVVPGQAHEQLSGSKSTAYHPTSRVTTQLQDNKSEACRT